MNASRKIQPSLSLDSNYHPETAGKLMANSKVMACFGFDTTKTVELIDRIATNQAVIYPKNLKDPLILIDKKLI